MAFRHALDDGDEIFMLGMPNGRTFDGEARNIEFGFRAEKHVDWYLRFDPMCLDLAAGTGEFLKITATDNDGSDALPNDEWQIDTGADTKTACLTKTGKGKVEDLIGLFDMQFGYTVCILADPDAGDGFCL